MSAPTTARLEAARCAVARAVRLSWQLSPSGRVAACTVVRDAAPALLEVRTPAGRTRHALRGLSGMSQLVPYDDGSVLACHHYGGEHVVVEVSPAGARRERLRLAAPSLWLLGGRADRPTLAVRALDEARTALLSLPASCNEPRRLATVPGRALAGVWLDGSRLAVTTAAGGRGSRTVAVDLADGSVEDLLDISPGSDDRVVAYLPATGTVVVSTDADGRTRLGVGPLDGRVRFPAALAADGPVSLLAGSADGCTVAVAVDAGAATRVLLLDTATDEAVEMTGHDTFVGAGSGHLDGTRLVLPVSAPDRPGTLLHLGRDGTRRVEDPALGSGALPRTWTAAGTQCLVLGDPSTSRDVVVALHGGPLDAWRAAYDPLLAALAAAGVAVVAPNVRGSTGYGRAHALAIRGCWGGPDLADVLAVADDLAVRRPAGARGPVVLGSSYGGWLAVLAAARAPGAWSGCVALSPFLSGARVEGRGGAVAELVRRLDGQDAPDLRAVCADVEVPVLLLHGAGDDVVPAGESALLAGALRAARRPVRHVEVADAGHDLTGGPRRGDVLDEVVRFATAPLLRVAVPARGPHPAPDLERRDIA